MKNPDAITKKTAEPPMPDIQKTLLGNLEKVFSGKLERCPSLRWGYGLMFRVQAEDAVEIFSKLKSDSDFLFDMLVDVTAVDWLDKQEPRFEVIYHLLSTSCRHRLCLRIGASEESPSVPSVRSLWPAANFLEREVWDMYGISFEGHGDLRRILMYDEFVGHPLRKDYPKTAKQPRVQMRVPELRNTSADMRREQLVSLPVRQRVGSNTSSSKEAS